MTPEEIRELCAFDAWANERVFEACAPLTPEQFVKPIASSFPSVRETLVHIVSGEWLWLELWLGRPRSRGKLQGYTSAFSDLASVRAGWREVEKERGDFLERVTAADLDRVIEFENLQGIRRAYPLRRMVQHVVNHSTYHRGQLITMLRQLGAKTCPTDYLYYFERVTNQPTG